MHGQETYPYTAAARHRRQLRRRSMGGPMASAIARDCRRLPRTTVHLPEHHSTGCILLFEGQGGVKSESVSIVSQPSTRLATSLNRQAQFQHIRHSLYPFILTAARCPVCMPALSGGPRASPCGPARVPRGPIAEDLGLCRPSGIAGSPARTSARSEEQQMSLNDIFRLTH